MTPFVVPGREQLEHTPDIVGWIVAGLDAADALWKPGPERWSVLEVVGHLGEIEAEGFRGRVEALLSSERPALPGIDPDRAAAAGAYTARPLPEALARFRAERARSLEILDRVRPEHLARAGIHGDLGVVTLGNLLHEWPLHDLGHVRQIAELVRARKYHPHIGPWRELYPMRP
jgi:hypothetical protein